MTTRRRQSATPCRVRSPNPTLDRADTSAPPSLSFLLIAIPIAIDPPTNHVLKTPPFSPSPGDDQIRAASLYVLVCDDAVDHPLPLQVVQNPVSVGCVGCIGARLGEERGEGGCEVLRQRLA